MVGHIPQTTEAEIVEEINALLNDPRYRSPLELRVQSLQIKADALIRADPPQGWLAKAMIEQLCGNKEQFLRAVDNARRLSYACLWEDTLATGLNNLGCFSESVPLFRNLLDPTKGNFSSLYQAALSAGCIQLTLEAYRQLPSRGIEMPSEFPAEKIERAASVLQTNGVSDDALSKFFDLAGQVLRERGLMSYGDDPEVEIIEVDTQETVHFIFSLRGSTEEVADANLDLALLAANFEQQTPSCVHISFRGLE